MHGVMVVARVVMLEQSPRVVEEMREEARKMGDGGAVCTNSR